MGSRDVRKRSEEVTLLLALNTEKGDMSQGIEAASRN